MKIKFIQNYKSIKVFREKEIKDFSVFTGFNGSGKTHILEAIRDDSIKVNNIDNNKIIYFNFSNFLLLNQPASNSASIAQLKTNAWDFLNQRKQYFTNFDNEIKKCFIETTKIENFYQSDDEYIKEGQKQNYEVQINEIINFIESQNKNNPKQISLLKSAFYSTNKLLSEINKLEFIRESNFDYLDYQLLNNLSEIFLEHKRKIALGNLGKKHGGLGLKRIEIKKLCENSPWNLINSIFKNYNLEHRVNEPYLKAGDFINNPNFSFQVELSINNVIIPFGDLSSGEKILVALAITVFQDTKCTFPELLLLDEIDATLHPSMIQKTLEVIKNVFIKNGSKAIMATHSPTTVAQVEDGSIYEIKKRDVQDKIVEINKEDALNILTDGFATLNKGLKFLDEVAKNKLTIITEGNNTKYIDKFLKLSEIKDVCILPGIEGRSGKTQLKALYDFFTKVPHDNEVLFIWDCDVKEYKKLEDNNKTSIFIFDKNEDNNIASKGIENLFSKNLFDGFCTEVKKSNGHIRKEFDKDRKNDFLSFILIRNNKDDFKNFEPLSDKINIILKKLKK